MTGEPKPTVGLFVTCLVDAIRPQIGFATLQLLQEAGCVVEVPQAQTCCGQPALNSGDDRDAAHLARQTIAAFEGYDYVVLPSGSCAATMVHGYPELLAGDPDWAARAQAMAAKTHEITSFLCDVMGYAPAGGGSMPPPPITTAARACASLASPPSPARCSAMSRGWKCAACPATMSAAASAAPSA